MKPHVRIVSTGGTIASTSSPEDAGKTPSVSGDDLVDAVPEIGEYASIDVEEVCQVSGFQMGFEEANAVAEAVVAARADAVDGVVVTHGTDTMAETAFFLECVLETEVPVVCTGAQRSFDQLGTDGPTNLLAAVRAVTHDRFQGHGGSYVAFNDTVHTGRSVVKAHTSKLETFQSPDSGPVATVTPDGLRFHREPNHSSPVLPRARFDDGIRVPLLTNAMGADGWIVERARETNSGADGFSDIDGLVVAGTGLGNTTGELGNSLETAVEHDVPVVLTSRCHAGATAGVYGGPGGAKTLLDAGAISGGDLPAWKARIVLALALSTDQPVDGRELFEGFST